MFRKGGKEMFSKGNGARVLALGVTVALMVMAISACAPAPTPAPPAEATPTPVPPTVEATATPVPTAPPTGPKQGGSIVWADYEPNTLNPYIVSEAVARPCAYLANRGLVMIDPDGDWFPMMAAEIPTKENGGISEDGKTITWRLLPGLKWSDGTPLTSDDIKFTWEAVSHPESTATQTQGFYLIESVETPDELTAVVHYKEFYVGWISQFGLGILPRHGTGDPADMGTWEWNRTVNPTNGPFILKEWMAADHLTYVRNPYWHEEGKPYLDEILYPITVDLTTQRQMLMAGENDVHHWLWLEPEWLEKLESQPNVTVEGGPAPYWTRIQFKLSERGDPRPSPPAKPHAILGDVRVRKAIGLALNREEITAPWGEKLLLQSMFYRGDFKCDLPPYEHDPEKAKALLEEAGWIDQDNDGVRECHGCMYAEEGTPLHLAISSYAGWGMEDYESIMADQLKQVGIDLYVENYETTVFYGTWGEGSPTRRGDFDILYWDYELGADPHVKAEDFYASWRIPTEDNPGGFNCTRIADEEVDNWLKIAGSTTDVETRREAYCNIANKIYDDIFNEYVIGVSILYYANSSRLKGWEWNDEYCPFAMVGWDAENWYIEE